MNELTVTTNSLKNFSQKIMELLVSDAVDKQSGTALATTVLLMVISLIGIVGNGLVLWAFRCQVSQGVVSSLLILLLACLDMIICSIGIPSTLYLDVWQGEATDFLCRAHLAFKGFIVPVSACLLVLIALERFLLICFIPGIGLRRTHLVWAFVIILLTGITLAIPMSLHVRAVHVVKAHDVLLQPLPPDDENHESVSIQFPKDVRVPVRCDKDDTFIDDTAYWYYQIVVISFFSGLFIATALFYLVIFLFVWRHESLMFERYGKSKYRGYFIRIQDSIRSMRSSVQCARNDNICETTNDELELNTRGNITKSDFPQHLPKSNDFSSPDANDPSMECACVCETEQSMEIKYEKLKTTKYLIQQHQQPQAITSASASFAPEETRTNNTEASLLEQKTVEPFEIEDDDLPETNKNYRCCGIKSNVKAKDTTLGNYNMNDKQNETVSQQTRRNPNPLTMEYKERTAVAIKTMERKRKPHVYTAKNFALIAAAFIISYTPYLVYTATPVSKRSLLPQIETKIWSVSLGRVLFYLYFANSAANPIIYSCMNRHFRSFLAKHFCHFRLLRQLCLRKQIDRVNAVSPSSAEPRQPRTTLKPADTTFEAS